MRAERDWITVFSEARLRIDEEGRAFAREAWMGGLGWTRGLSTVPRVRLAARASTRLETADVVLEGPRVVCLPYYVGVWQMVRSSWRLVLRVDNAVSQSSAVVVRVPGGIGLIAGACAILRHKPLAAEIVGDTGDVLRSGSIGAVAKCLRLPVDALTRQIVGQASAVRYVTEEVLQRKYPARRTAKVTAYSSVVLSEDWIADRAHSELEAQRPNLVAVGSQEQLYKGHDVLIRALPLLVRDSPDISLTLIGSGRYQSQLRALSMTLGVGERVAFAGYITDKQNLKSTISRAWVFVMPSRTEGLPRALVEAMALGVPCVGTTVGGMPELLDAQFLASPDNPADLARRIAMLLNDQRLRESQSVRNIERAQAFSPQRLALKERAWADSVRSVHSQAQGGQDDL